MYDADDAKLTRLILKIVGYSVLGLFALICFFRVFKVVGVGEVGLVTNFGQVVSQRDSGIQLLAPWQDLATMDVKTQKEQQEASASSNDLQVVKTTIALNYHLTPETAKKVYVEVGDKYAQVVIDPILQESVKSVTSQYKAGDLIVERPRVEKDLFEKLQSKLAPKGITVDNVSIVNFDFSAEFNQAIEAVQVANQKVLEAQQALAKAKVNAEQTITEAEAKAKANTLQRETLTPLLLQKMAIEKWDGKMPNTVAGDGSVLTIPLK